MKGSLKTEWGWEEETKNVQNGEERREAGTAAGFCDAHKKSHYDNTTAYYAAQRCLQKAQHRIKKVLSHR